MKQSNYNKYSFIISAIALLFSIGIPLVQWFLDKPDVDITSENKITISQQYGVPTLGIAVNIINKGSKETLITKITCAFFQDDKLIKKDIEMKTFINNMTSTNSIFVRAKEILPINLFYNTDELNNEQIKNVYKINSETIEYLIKKDIDPNNKNQYQIYEISDTLYSKIEKFSLANLKNSPLGECKILVYVYENNNHDKPKHIFAKSFSIQENDKFLLTQNIRNYRYASHIVNNTLPLFAYSTQIKALPLSENETENLKRMLLK